ncbi:MAG: beta-galactosidase [Oscillospiraceae bacterium]|nr:beta-galactosidase [Oscillospiraceae bacterium]
MVTWHDRSFYIDGEPVCFHCGAIHYFRSLPEKWPELLRKLKQCGMNAVETYCAWNLHESKPGEFCFEGRADVEKFIEIAEKEGLYVIVRPGPYICGEWEFGGLPGWLLKDEGFRYRTDEGDYLKYTKRYFDELMPRIIPHLQTKGGNVVLFAAENEYGSFGNSRTYMNKCVQMLKDYGVDVPVITADGHTGMYLDGGKADDSLITINFGYSKGELTPEHTRALWENQPNAPVFHMEHWVGAISHWNEGRMTYDPDLAAEEVQAHLEQNASFNLYMFHGGTNFGFYNGANAFMNDPDNLLRLLYYPDVTSYDYDAVLTEWGEITPKYLAIQKVMSKYLGKELPVPAPVPTMSLGDVPLTACASLFENLENVGTKHISSCIHHMEHYDQSYGYILYRTHLRPNKNVWLLAMTGLADRAHVFFNGIWRGTLDRNQKDTFLKSDGWLDEGGTLDILVENQGRVNFALPMDKGDRKGILEHVYVGQTKGPCQILYNWEVYTLPMENLQNLQYGSVQDKKHPVFYKGSFKATEKKDCFVHLDNFTKGFVVVNGFNLGRYWEIGPQRSLYLPGALLKDENEIIVFAEEATETPTISIKDYHILDAIKTNDGPETVTSGVDEK